MNSKRPLALAAPLAILSACSATPYNHIDSPDPAFGESVKYSMAIQVIDPEPVYDPQGAQPGDNGEVAANAVERYRTGENVERHKTESRMGASGGSAGGSGAAAGGPQ